jgi:dynein heavy chain
MEKTLAKLEETWKDICFEFSQHKDTDIKLLRLNEDDFDMLEENQVQVNAMFSSRYLATFEVKCVYWQKSLASISEVVQLLGEVQRSWSFLENLFIHSEEVKKELPKESERFVGIDQETKAILKEGDKAQKALTFCTQENIFPRLEKVQDDLNLC